MVAKKKTRSKSASKKQSLKPTAKKDTCFIIMPFGDWFDYYYETIYVPAIESAGLKPRRADNLYRPSAIVNDIWDLTQQSKIVLADLSGKNPNVFYELGLAHAVAKPAILVTQSIDDVPFDLRALRVLIYDKNEPEWGRVLREKITTAISEVLASPLEAVLPTFISVRDTTKKTTVTKEEKELISIRQDIDALKRTVQSKATSSPITLTTEPSWLTVREPYAVYGSRIISPQRGLIIDADEMDFSNMSRIIPEHSRLRISEPEIEVIEKKSKDEDDNDKDT